LSFPRVKIHLPLTVDNKIARNITLSSPNKMNPINSPTTKAVIFKEITINSIITPNLAGDFGLWVFDPFGYKYT
jgi:hypothetical protein